MSVLVEHPDGTMSRIPIDGKPGDMIILQMGDRIVPTVENSMDVCTEQPEPGEWTNWPAMYGVMRPNNHQLLVLLKSETDQFAAMIMGHRTGAAPMPLRGTQIKDKIEEIRRIALLLGDGVLPR